MVKAMIYENIIFTFLKKNPDAAISTRYIETGNFYDITVETVSGKKDFYFWMMEDESPEGAGKRLFKMIKDAYKEVKKAK